MKTRILSIFVLLGLFAGLALPQATMTSTTLSVALDASATSLTVASATGILAPSANQDVRTILFIDREAMAVAAVSGTTITVRRGYDGTRPSSHAASATVYVGPPNYYYGFDPAGSCTSTAEVVLPRVVIPTGNVWNCVSGAWNLSVLAEDTTGLNVGTAGTGVTATEYGNSRNHITKLTFSGLSLVAPAGAESLAGGALIYTLPTGAVVVKAAYMNVALAGSGATCDADTPDTGVGTTVGSGANALLSSVGAAAENILTGQTSDDCNGTAEVKTISNQILTVEAAGNHTVYLNTADGWAGACTITASGSVILEWVYLP